ncbi:MAG: type 1 periplasmic binding fold superfamily protein [Bacteroidetes bacterium]|nr:MAG: type 1 periplasmic binding fold superfamily protein [Bacteroidota bacterium]
MKKNTLSKLMFLALSATVLATACKKEKDDENEEELITTLRVNAREAGTTTTTSFLFRDPDGDGGAGPTRFDTIRLAPNKTYNITLEFLNESVTPAENITDEILAEAGDHQVYHVPAGVNITVNTFNVDAAGLPLGTTANWVTGAAGGFGTLRIALKHKPGQKTAGDAITKGETDIDVNFVTRVQ